jgi:hypothetical protein
MLAAFVVILLIGVIVALAIRRIRRQKISEICRVLETEDTE